MYNNRRMTTKTIKLLILIPLVFLSSCKQTYKPKELDENVTYSDVYLIMGQSNASGISPYAFLENSNPEVYQRYIEGNQNVLMTYDCDDHIEKNYVPVKFGYANTDAFFGPEIGIADVVNSNKKTSYIIKATYSATCLQTQYVHNRGKKLKYYRRFVAFIKEQLTLLESQGKTPRVKGVFWMQGESDSFLEYSYKYEQAEQFFLNYLRLDLNNWIYDHFNFVDAYIFTRGICWVNPEIINNCKQQLADKNNHCYCIKTNGEDENAIRLTLKCETGEGDDLAHYDSSSMLLLGQTAGHYLLK